MRPMALALLVTLLQGGCSVIFPFDLPPQPDAAAPDRAPADAPADAPALIDSGDAFAGDLGYPCTCAIADGTGDGKVDLSDLASLQACFGKPATDSCKPWDYNGDGVIGGPDMGCMTKFYGHTCSADAALDLMPPIPDGGGDLGYACTCDKVDFNADGAVDSSDLAFLSSCYGQPLTKVCKVADINGDGMVDVLDLACLGKWFSTLCP